MSGTQPYFEEFINQKTTGGYICFMPVSESHLHRITYKKPPSAKKRQVDLLLDESTSSDSNNFSFTKQTKLSIKSDKPKL